MNLLEKLKILLKQKYVQYGIVGLLLLTLIWFSFAPKKIVAETAIIHRGTLVQFVEEEGITRVREKYSMLSPVNGVLNRVEKHVGDKVKKGEVLAIIDWDNKRKVMSPVNGKILQVFRESAGPIGMGNPILDIGDISSQEVVADVLTQEAVKIKPGDEVILDGWGGSPLTGTVRLTESEAFKKISSLGVEEQRVRVLIDFSAPDTMGEGFKVICKIQTRKEENQLLVPSPALFREGESWAVFIVENHRARKKLIKLKTRSGGFASVEEGLSENDEVILFPGEGITEGVKIK